MKQGFAPIPAAGNHPAGDEPANLVAEHPALRNNEAIREWLVMCAYEKCSHSNKRILASIGQSVGRELEAKRPDLGVRIRQTEAPEGSIDSSHWSIFEVYVIMGRELGIHKPLTDATWSPTTEKAIKIKRFIQSSRQPSAYVHRIIARALLDHARYESQRPMRGHGKLRTSSGGNFCRLGWTDDGNSPNLPAEELKRLPGLTALLGVEPEVFTIPSPDKLAKVSDFAKQEFLRMSRGKNRSLLIAFAARFLEISITSKTVLDACGAKNSSSPCSTLQKYLHALNSKPVFSVMDPKEKKALVAHFIDEFRGLVIQWAAETRPFASMPQGTPSP